MVESPEQDPSPLPLIPKDLMEAIAAQVPEKCPDISWSDRQVWFEAGKRELVRWLLHVYHDQCERRGQHV